MFFLASCFFSSFFFFFLFFCCMRPPALFSLCCAALGILPVHPHLLLSRLFSRAPSDPNRLAGASRRPQSGVVYSAVQNNQPIYTDNVVRAPLLCTGRAGGWPQGCLFDGARASARGMLGCTTALPCDVIAFPRRQARANAVGGNGLGHLSAHTRRTSISQLRPRAVRHSQPPRQRSSSRQGCVCFYFAVDHS